MARKLRRKKERRRSKETLHILIERSAVEDGEMEAVWRYVHMLRNVRPQYSSASLSLNGYEDDPREVWQSQEIANFFLYLVVADPAAFFGAQQSAVLYGPNRQSVLSWVLWLSVGFGLMTPEGDMFPDLMKVLRQHLLGLSTSIRDEKLQVLWTNVFPTINTLIEDAREKLANMD